MSEIIWLYVIHNDDETIFIIENNNEYGFVDFLVYNRYIKINRPDTEITVAEYAITNSVDINNEVSLHLDHSVESFLE